MRRAIWLSTDVDYNVTRANGAEVLDQRVAKDVGACAEGVVNYAIMGFSP